MPTLLSSAEIAKRLKIGHKWKDAIAASLTPHGHGRHLGREYPLYSLEEFTEIVERTRRIPTEPPAGHAGFYQLIKLLNIKTDRLLRRALQRADAPKPAGQYRSAFNNTLIDHYPIETVAAYLQKIASEQAPKKESAPKTATTSKKPVYKQIDIRDLPPYAVPHMDPPAIWIPKQLTDAFNLARG